MIHQLNMRLSVAVRRDPEAELKAKEKAETPTVKTKEQVEREEALRAKYGTPAKETHPIPLQSIWKRKFRPLPEAKAVDLFADVVGDAFILMVAGGLIIYEYQRSSQKPDMNLERIKTLNEALEDLKKREQALEEAEEQQRTRLEAIEVALRAFTDPKTKRPLLATPSA